MKTKIGVIFGGLSVEHEVSIISAVQAMNKIDLQKYEVVPIYITKENEWYTSKALMDIELFKDLDLIKRYAKNVILVNKNNQFILQKKNGLFKSTVETIDIAFPIVHGANVEDGVLQGHLETVGIPYVGSNVYASAVAQDKVYMKQILEQAKVSLTKYIWFYDHEYTFDSEEILKQIKKLGFPVIIKPATLGSSVGINIANNEVELVKAIEDAISYDKKIMVEEVVTNLKEVNVSVLGNYENYQLSEIEEVIKTKAFLSYEDKYISKSKTKGSVKSKGMLSTNRIIPANITKEQVEDVKKLALSAARTLGMSGVIRIDFLIDNKSKKVYLNEVNNIPGSLAFYLWEAKDKNQTALIDDLINIAIKDYKKRISKTHVFESNILSGYQGGTKGTKGKLL